MRVVAPEIKAAGGCSILNVSSIGGDRPLRGEVAYAASKWAIRGMSRVAAIDLGPHRIRVNALLPGVMDTPSLSATTRALVDAGAHPAVAALPLERMSDPGEVAAFVAFLASDDASYCTGADYVCDGGMLTIGFHSLSVGRTGEHA